MNKQKPATKKFLNSWLLDPLFSDWLAEIPASPENCYCTVCDTVLKAGHSELEKHAAGKKHMMNQKFLRALKIKGPGPSAEYMLDDFLDNAQVVNGSSLKTERKTSAAKGEEKSQFRRHFVKLPGGDASINSNTICPDTKKRKSSIDVKIPFRTNIPEQLDLGKLLSFMQDEDFDDDDDDLSDTSIQSSEHPMQRIPSENLTNEDFQTKKGRFDVSNVKSTNTRELIDKELEARIAMVNEKRRYQTNIYKLKLVEIRSRIEQAAAEQRRAEELHQLQTAQLQLQIQRENGVILSPTETESHEKDETADKMQ